MRQCSNHSPALPDLHPTSHFALRMCCAALPCIGALQAGKNINRAAEDAKDAVGDAYDSAKEAAR